MDFDHTRRWNIEETAQGIRICKGDHERSAPCEWEEYIPRFTENCRSVNEDGLSNLVHRQYYNQMIEAKNEVIARYRGWLQYISDLSYDRDGYHNAKDLGDLVDELRDCAITALDEEKEPESANRKHGDKSLYPGQLVGADASFHTLTVQVSKEWFDQHVIRMNSPCFIRGLEIKRD